MAYNMAANQYTCDFCGIEIPWDASDDIHGNMWGCEACGCEFCSKCFIDRHGREKYERMMQESDKVLCPDCYEKIEGGNYEGI